ncbi:hypothetical protein GQ44DRAFT_778258 [Phaeosphaeriaceae sp. PMI808]|nr:hypothetical protein GQ44DRAFT_778258 [Phaeosphaeriaceae sp. PMI808]
MKVYLNTIISGFFTILAVVNAAAVPTIGTGQFITPNTDIQVRQSDPNKIVVKIGSNFVNVGNTINGELYNTVYVALKTACLKQGYTTCRDGKAKFQVWHSDNNFNADSATSWSRKEVEMTVESFGWGGVDKMYDLLIGGVAGVIERAAYQVNCRKVGTSNICQTTNSVEISAPNNYFIKVKLKGTGSQNGGFGCGKVSETAGAYVESLRPEFQTIVAKGDLWVDTQCV